jgi:hypothetical protein
MSKDWRLENLEGLAFLHGVSFTRKPYRPYPPGWEHDHCAACWVTLAEPPLEGEDVVHEGYATNEDYIHGVEYDWVCVSCFDLFRDHMAWIEIPA